MSTFLQLAQALRQECAISGAGPVTVSGQTGEMKRVCDWINRAWTDIQEDNPDWAWMRKSVSFNTIAQQATYSPTLDMSLTDFGSWRNGSFRAYLTSVGVMNEMALSQMDYNAFRDYYMLGSRRVTYARPVTMSITPEQNISLGLAPDDVYTVTGEYYKTPQILALDADTPDMPSRFHQAIIYRAMMFYGTYENASEVYASGEKEYRKILHKLRMNQAPMVKTAGSMI